MIPTNAQIEAVKALLQARTDATEASVLQLVAECDDFLAP